MNRFTAFILCLFLFLYGCALPQNVSPDSEAELLPQSPSPIYSVPEPEIIPSKPSCVEEMALDVVNNKKLSAGQREAAIRGLYHYLIESVWLSDPVGLDTWRYLSDDDQTPIPYLENRALSPLLFGIGSCEDFASAMVMLLRAAGFEAEYVAGFTLSVKQEYIDHAWAVVNLDGTWYHIDPQLEQNVTRGHLLTYRYYLKSDEDFFIDHKWGENLIEYWPDMPDAEKAAIRSRHIPPECTATYPAPSPISIPLPLRPGQNEIDRLIRQIKLQSGKGELPPIWLDVEPPILVASRHVTPPLLDDALARAYPQSAFRYGRGFLQGPSARLYDSLETLLYDPFEDAGIILEPGVSDADAARVIDQFLWDNPRYYWAAFKITDEADSRVLRLELSVPLEEIQPRQLAIDRRAAEILEPVRGASPFEIATAIHDSLAEVPYDRSENVPDRENIYGALVMGAATCNGYASAFQYLAGLAGLDSVYLKGESLRGVAHAWNAVRLDSSWHFVDCTWDRPLGQYDDVYHDFFLMDTASLLSERRWDKSQYPAFPEPSEGFMDYYTRMGYTVSGDIPENADSVLADIFYRQIMAKPSLPSEARPIFLECRVAGSPEAYAQWKSLYIKRIFNILQNMQELAVRDNAPFVIVDLLSVTCDFNDTTQVLTLYPIIRQED